VLTGTLLLVSSARSDGADLTDYLDSGLAQEDKPGPVLVLAAASLTDVLSEIGKQYETDGRRVRFSFGGSDALAAQVRRGAPADIVVFAGASPMDGLEAEGLIDPGTRRDLATNSLVVVRRAGPGLDLHSLRDLTTVYTGKVAIADPQLAPAGRYAEAAMRGAGLWEGLSRRLILAADVRAALSAVSSGNAEFGFAYLTDTYAIKDIQLALTVPAGSYPPIAYPAAVVSASNRRAAADDFLRYMAIDAQSQRLWAQYGFATDAAPQAGATAGAGPRASDASIVLLSLRVAGLAMLFVTPLGLAVAWLLVRKRVPGRFWIEALVSLPLALTPVVVGFALLNVLGRNSALGGLFHRAFGGDIAFTWVAAALASAVVAFPLSVRAFMVAFAGVDRRLELAARGLGAAPWRVLFTITLPLAYQGVLAGLLLGFVRALSEFGATIIVAGNIPGQTQTLPLAIFTRISSGQDSAATRLIITSAVLAAVTIAIHNYLLTRAARARPLGEP